MESKKFQEADELVQEEFKSDRISMDILIEKVKAE